MPLIDSRNKVIFGEINPEKRRCQYLFCQSFRKHKACSKCKYVRYCSPECQKADWPNHKKVCGRFNTPIFDAAAWRDNYENLFRWAAMHALEAHWKLSKIRSHYLLVHVLYGDHLVGATPSPFEVEAVEVISHAELRHIAHWSGDPDGKDVAECRKIQDEGGLGQATVLFRFPPPRAYMDAMKNPQNCYLIRERYKLTERRDPSTPRVASIEQVEETVKRRINGAPLPGMLDALSAMLHNQAISTALEWEK
ncbi:hypothetical protein GSI_04196 [Ganoderma sinense ZZ0214-1]|uniref:MYND-type domain-containing protein n=1 Tax=Ganoderma sinense ZZ0214-1 TaxID=1077348 RepID=A0A2G8SIH7_9APHY|nr:hypothetical protein GSI_04196 [Ganoderma sinense ZZ0214-1]